TPENPYTVSTFECVGIYYKVDSADPGQCKVNYRRSGSEQWKAGLDLWFDERDSEYRGSIVGLTPDTEYEIELVCEQQNIRFKTRTRSEEFKIGKTTTLDAGVTATTVRITESGNEDGWHLVTPKPGDKTIIDPENTMDYNIVVEASFVIIRGIELKNAAIHGILVERGVHDVVVEDCDITFWGRIGGPRTFGNTGGSDSAIYAKEGTARLVIQRNSIHDPRGASNDWDTGHPSGPQAITLHNSRGGNIIRYNDIFSTEDHGFNDAFGGGSNFSDRGSPNRDSDIYGNIISNVWDDAIESEGANMNVRIWGNYTHHTFQHIAVACTSKGPLYIFRNVFGLSRRTHRDPLGGSMIKVGQRDQYGGGRRYVFHNTALQPKGAFRVFSSHSCPNTITRNNIFDCPGPLTGSRPADPPSDFDYDVFTGLSMRQGYERHGIRRDPAFVRSHRLEFYLAPTISTVKWGRTPTPRGDKTVVITDKVITIPNPAIDAGVLIPGFNDDYKGKAPDMGAFERGNPPIKFGRDAQGRTVPAPWEEF
ncbi:MAG: right-handed parallel beta-helix repeat-containing protein, partial [Planctomycetota bacterium]